METEFGISQRHLWFISGGQRGQVVATANGYVFCVEIQEPVFHVKGSVTE